jgi:hypothetical protein
MPTCVIISRKLIEYIRRSYGTSETKTTLLSIPITIGIGTLTTGAPYAATTAGVKVSTTQDTISAGGASSSTASPAIAVCPAVVDGGAANAAKSSAPAFAASLATIVACIFGLLVL